MSSLPRPSAAGTSLPQVNLLQRQIHWLLLWRVIALTFLLGMTVLLHTPERPLFAPPVMYIAYFIAFIYAYTISSAILLKQVRNHLLFLFYQVMTDIAFTSLLVYFSGCSQSIFIIVFFFPIICSGLVNHSGYRLALILSCIASYGGILYLEFIGQVPVISGTQWKTQLTSPFIVLYRLSVPGVTFFLVAFLSSLLTDRLRKTEEALSETSQSLDRLALLYRQIFNDITTGIITVDPQGLITSFNPAAEEISGWTRNKMIGRSLASTFPGLTGYHDKNWRPVTELIRANMESIPIGYSRAPLNLPGEEGNSVIYTFQDLSQIREMENKIRQAEKMASIGQMAAGIAHEFRNPLAAISGAAQILFRESADPHEGKLMKIILRESDRLEKTITEFLLFSRPGDPHMRWFSLARLVDETLEVLEKSADWRPTTKVFVDLPSLLDCWGDPNQIKQVLINLFANSCQAMGAAAGTITISARELTGTHEEANVEITIADTGPGMKEPVMNRLFEPFFTTRENGTGLGLAIVWQIIDAHHGTIVLANRHGGGACATIVLPLP